MNRLIEILKGALVASAFLMWNAALGQVQTVSGYNYYDINEDAFLVDASCAGLTAEDEAAYNYYFTSLKLAVQLDSIFNVGQDSLDLISGGYQFSKRSYLSKTLGGENFRIVFLRPNDTIERPLVLITHGGKTGGASPIVTLPLGVVDYVQRGYAVGFYQSGSYTGDPVDALSDAGFTSPCLYNWSPDDDPDCFQQAVMVKAQFVRAALYYASAKASTFHLDTSNFFGIGFSGGGVGVLTAILADSNNFADPLFAGLGSLDELSMYPNETTSFKAVKTLAGGIINENLYANYKMGDLLTSADSAVQVLMIHGQDDFAVKPTTSPLIWTDPSASLPGSQIDCAMQLKDRMDNLEISNKVVINCSAGHDVFTWPCDINDDYMGNNQPFLATCLGWYLHLKNNTANYNFSNVCATANFTEFVNITYVLKQIHDYSRIGASFFHQNFPDVGPNHPSDGFLDSIFENNEVVTINPIGYPHPVDSIASDGTWVFSEKCLHQNCSGLYFNRFGNDNINGLGYKGDYIQTTDFSSSTDFNQDFTLEIRFKCVDQSGPGVLFSHLNTSYLGFEIQVNSNGYLQFKKNLNGQGAITGDVDVRDGDCHTAVLTRGGDVFSLYLDQELQETSKNYPLTFLPVNETRMGNTSNELVSSRGFNGFIRNVRIWNMEIGVLDFGQNNLPNGVPGLTANWCFDETIGQHSTCTNQSYTWTLGSDQGTASYDPRWMEDDALCACDDDEEIVAEIAYSDVLMALVYPNPNSGSFVVQLKNPIGENAEIQIYSSTGSLVKKLGIRYKNTTVRIDKPGVYFVVIQNELNRVVNKVIVTN